MILCKMMTYGALRDKCNVRKTRGGLKVRLLNRVAADRQLQQLSNPSVNAYATISRVLPPVHILVRAQSAIPLRWFFVPLSVDLAGMSLNTSDETKPELRVQSGIIMMLRDNIHSVPYGAMIDYQLDPVYKALQSLLPLLTFTADIEEELTRETLINYQDWLDTFNVEISQLRHTVRAIQLHIAETNDSRQRPLQLLLKYLELHFTMPSAGGNQSKTVAVPVLPALEEAIEAFNIYYETHKAVTAKLELGAVHANIEARLLHGHYPTDSAEVLRDRAHAELVILILDLLIQRYKAKGGVKQQLFVSCEEQHDDIIIRVKLDSLFSTLLEWDSRQESLDRFPRNRGFFFNAVVGTSVRVYMANCWY